MSDRHLAPTTPVDSADTSTTRRTVLRTAGLLALTGGGVTAFGACAADAEPTAPTTSAAASPSTAASSSAPAPASSSAPAPSPASSSAPAAPTGPSAATADIPVGGGVILEDADYVITQPTQGEFRAFSKICTHRSCAVTTIADGTINCRCHGSKFSVKDGSVANPPASQPLAESQVTVMGDQVFVTV